MKKIIWILIVVGIIWGVWLFMKEPARAPEVEIMEQEIAEHAPEETTGADDSRESTLEDMMPPVTE